MIAKRLSAELLPDPTRVVAQLFLPGEELHLAQSRASQIVSRVLGLAEADAAELSEGLLRDFSARHHDYRGLLERHASIVAGRVKQNQPLSEERNLLLGASFTAEYASEGAALCNPSAVLHPDQSGLDQDQVRLAVSLRGIGEGHISSIGFCSAVVGPGPSWVFEPRGRPVSTATVAAARWRIVHLRSVLAGQGHLNELCEAVLRALPDEFDSADLEQALAGTHYDLLTRAGSSDTVELLRKTVASAYTASFPKDSELSQRVLVPSAQEESNGMEDARFTRFIHEDGRAEYRATYTAYDGQLIAPRLLVSPDLRVFHAHRLAGRAARNKGMALFPRLVGGKHLALCRSDGESTSLAVSADGYVWGEPVSLQAPSAAWEMLQVGNCGPPIETDRGWLVLTHGVGPMRVYAIGAMLLDLANPTIVRGQLALPLLSPARDGIDGYVPNVVYSCGGFLHAGRVWIPFGADDARIGVAYVELADLLDELDELSTDS